MIFVFFVVLFFTLLDVSRKIVSKDFSSLSITFFMVLTMALGYSVVAVPEFLDNGITSKSLYLGVLSGIFGMIANLSFVSALRSGPISVLTPLLGFSALATVFCDYLFLSKTLSLFQSVGLFIVLLGSLLLVRVGSLEEVSRKCLLLALLAASGWGIQTFLDPIGMAEVGVFRWGAIISISILIPLLYFVKDISFCWKLIFPGIFLFLASFSQLKALESVSSGVLESVKRGTILPLAVLLGFLIFQESVTKRKLVSIFVLLLGGVLVSLN